MAAAPYSPNPPQRAAAPQMPAPYQPEKFKPAGSDMQATMSPEAMMQNFQSLNQDEQAAAFQKHLETGLQGMQAVLGQLPPEVKAMIPDPAAYANTEERRAMWYQNVNVVINKANAKAQAAAGDIAGSEQTMLNDPSAAPADFTNVANRNAERSTLGAVLGGGEAAAPAPADAAATSTSPISAKLLTGRNVNRRTKIAQKFYPVVEAAAAKHKIDPTVMKALMLTEADDNVSPDSKNSETSATGLFQIIDSTGEHLGVKDRKDPGQSAEGAAKYLAQHMSMFGNDLEKAIVAYHDGPGAVADYIKEFGEEGWHQGISPKGRDHLSRVKGYTQTLGGTFPGSPMVASKPTNPSSQEWATRMLKNDKNLDPDRVKKYADLLGDSGKGMSEYQSIMAAVAQKNASGRDDRFETAEERKENEFLVRRADKFQKSNESSISAGALLADVNRALVNVGLVDGIDGDPKSVSIPGYGVGEAAWRGFLQDDRSVDLRTSVSNLHMIVRHNYFGATLTDNELKAFKEASATGIPDNQVAFVSALRKIRIVLDKALTPTGDDLKKYLRDEGVFFNENLPRKAEREDEADGAGTDDPPPSADWDDGRKARYQTWLADKAAKNKKAQ